MAKIDCEDIIRKAIGRNMSEEEIENFLKEGKKLYNQMMAGPKAAFLQDKAQQAARQMAKKKMIEAIIKKRAVKLQIAARYNAVHFALNNFKGMEAEGISALMVGSKYYREGARLSVDSISNATMGRYLSGLIYDIRKLGKAHFALFRKGEIDLEIYKALWSLGDPNTSYNGNKMALEIAQAIYRWQEKARFDQNLAGAWISKDPGYIIRQSHDAVKLRKFGLKEWKKDIHDKLDWDKTADGDFDPVLEPDKADEFLNSIYRNIVTGVNMKAVPDLPMSRTGGDYLAARLSKERILHFMNGESRFEYDQKYGIGTLNETVIRGLTKAARASALMKVFGPSPQINLSKIIDDIERTIALRPGMHEKPISNAMKERLKNQMDVLDGTVDMEGNPTLAAAGRNIRSIESMSKLGMAMFSSFTDIPVFASEMAYQGHNFFAAMGQGLASLIQGRGTLEQQRILSLCGVFFDSMCGDVAARFSGNEMPGKMTALQNLFFRLNGLSWWTDSCKKGACLMMAHDLAHNKNNGWQNLNKDLRRALSLYGIDEGRWEMLRKGKTQAADGRDYLTPEAAFDISDNGIRDYLQNHGKKKISEARIKHFRYELADQLRAFFRDRVQYAVLEPDSRTKAIMTQGTKAGTVPGEALRFVMQFKAFPTSFLQRSAAREIYGRGTDNFWRGAAESIVPFLKNQYGEAGNFARLFLMMTLFGYGAMTCKQLMAGKTPRDPTDWKTWVAAAMQGGGLGIYGDFLFSGITGKNRMGTSAISSLLGPFAGSFESGATLFNRAKELNATKTEIFKYFFNHFPGNNLFWFRTAFDYTIGYELYEMMNPGYIHRLRKNIKKETGQKFWLEPRRW